MSFVHTALAALLIVGAPSLSQAAPAWQSARLSEPPESAPEPPDQSDTGQQNMLDTSAGLDALVTDRPDATESPETIAAGRFQLETGYTFTSLESVRTHTLGEFLLRVGVHDNIELRFGLNSYALVRGGAVTADGLENFGVGAKFRLLSGGGVGHARPTIAILVGTSIPTGSDEIDASSAHPEARIAAGWDLSEVVSVSTNLIWSSIKDDALDERFSEWGVSLALGYVLSDRWGAYLEYFGAYPSGGRDTEDFVNAGLTYLISNDLQLDARVGYGLNDRDDDFFVGVGTAVRW